MLHILGFVLGWKSKQWSDRKPIWELQRKIYELQAYKNMYKVELAYDLGDLGYCREFSLDSGDNWYRLTEYFDGHRPCECIKIDPPPDLS
jgi:hypothetical protein